MLSVPGKVMTVSTYYLFAVFVKRVFDEERSQGKAQRVVCVADARLPTRSARLERHTVTLLGMLTINRFSINRR